MLIIEYFKKLFGHPGQEQCSICGQWTDTDQIVVGPDEFLLQVKGEWNVIRQCKDCLLVEY